MGWIRQKLVEVFVVFNLPREHFLSKRTNTLAESRPDLGLERHTTNIYRPPPFSNQRRRHRIARRGWTGAERKSSSRSKLKRYPCFLCTLLRLRLREGHFMTWVKKLCPPAENWKKSTCLNFSTGDNCSTVRQVLLAETFVGRALSDKDQPYSPFSSVYYIVDICR